MDKRTEQRQKGNLERFLTSVKKSSRMSQFDELPFRKLSSSKKFQSVLVPKQPPVRYFESEFEIIERLGFGDFAEVFKVRWKADGQFYAVKRSICRFNSCFENEYPIPEQLRWMDEAFYHSAISGHPNIVECVQSWEEAGYFHIQMEYLPQRLDEFVEKQYPLSETVLWDILTDMLIALEHVHGNGYIHLDIKPENIFLDEFGFTKLGDFGLITMSDSDQKEAGDSRYMPMESLASENLGYAVDIFSLGITMLELCSDIRLESHGPQWRALREIKWPVNVTESIPLSMRQILRQMMSENPRLRPSAAALLRLTPIRIHAIQRRAQILNVPFLRLKRKAGFLLKAVASTGTEWFGALLRFSSSQSSKVRPATPEADLNYVDYSMKFDFNASVIQPESPEKSFVTPLEDSVVVIERSASEENEMLSQSFLELLDSENDLEVQLKSDLFGATDPVARNLLDDLSFVSDEEETDEAEFSREELLDNNLPDDLLQNEELNKVHVLPDVVDVEREL